MSGCLNRCFDDVVIVLVLCIITSCETLELQGKGRGGANETDKCSKLYQRATIYEES